MLPVGLDALVRTLPLEQGARLDLSEGFPVFRAPLELQARIEALVLAQQSAPLSDDEQAELDRYESLDDFLSLVNRVVRNTFGAPPTPAPPASAAQEFRTTCMSCTDHSAFQPLILQSTIHDSTILLHSTFAAGTTKWEHREDPSEPTRLPTS